MFIPKNNTNNNKQSKIINALLNEQKRGKKKSSYNLKITVLNTLNRKVKVSKTYKFIRFQKTVRHTRIRTKREVIKRPLKNEVVRTTIKRVRVKTIPQIPGEAVDRKQQKGAFWRVRRMFTPIKKKTVKLLKKKVRVTYITMRRLKIVMPARGTVYKCHYRRSVIKTRPRF